MSTASSEGSGLSTAKFKRINFNKKETMEERILNSKEPIEVFESEEFSFEGTTSLLLNKSEILEWKGGGGGGGGGGGNGLGFGFLDYPINQDAQPELIHKRNERTIEYMQEICVRYLRPPTPPEPGDIIIEEMAAQAHAPAPPIIIRQQPPRASTPEPLVIRERPPTPPRTSTSVRKITISGRAGPPPPRKVIVEQLPPIPPKPQSVIIERWLPYPNQKRRVIFQKAMQQEVEVIKPKNIIIQWDPPEVFVNRKIVYLGVVTANPDRYRERFGAELVASEHIPAQLRNIPHPDGIVLAAEQRHNNNNNHPPYYNGDVPELYGDVHALKHVDLDRENLAEYKPQLTALMNSHVNEYLASPPQSPSPLHGVVDSR